MGCVDERIGVVCTHFLRGLFGQRKVLMHVDIVDAIDEISVPNIVVVHEHHMHLGACGKGCLRQQIVKAGS